VPEIRIRAEEGKATGIGDIPLDGTVEVSTATHGTT
jgi:hypothetical protein